MDNLTFEQRRKNMQNIRSTGTLPERLLFSEFRKKKIYFSKYVKTLPGKPDIVFRKKKIAIFVDSDFWHGHPKNFIMPKTNKKYWSEKIKYNKLRDKKVNKLLRQDDWKVCRVWESEIKKNLLKCSNKLYRLYTQ